MKKKFRFVKSIVNVICWILVAVIVLAVTITLVARINNSIPTVFGYSIFRVSSGSMEPELKVGDVILDKVVDNPEDLQIGDVITFKSNEYGGMLVTHKIVKAPYEENGKLMLQTKGIANELADNPINTDCIEGVMICKLDYLDTVYNIFLSPWGLLILIAMIIIIFFDEIVTIVKILTNNDKSAKNAENINDIIDRLQAENLQEQVEKPEEKLETEIKDNGKNEE